MPVAHYPHAMGAEALARSRPPEASQGTSQLQQRERAAQLGCFQGFPLSFPHPLLYRPAVAEAEASWQQQSPATGSPPGSTARFIPRPSLLPGPWHQPAPWQAPLSDCLWRGHRLLSPLRPPTSSLGTGGLPTPLIPAQLPPSARQDRVRPCSCCHPNLTPRAGAAHFSPTRLAAARPRCLPCWLLVSLAPQGVI